MSSSKKRPSFQTLGQTIVTVKVSSEAKPFNIHKDLLCQYSAYFRKAFTGSFKEAQEGAITLSDVNVETFRVFMDWLYYQELIPGEGDLRALDDGKDVASDRDSKLSDGNASNTTIDVAKSRIWRYNRLIKLYAFGDRYDVPGLRNAVVDIWQAIRKDEHQIPSLTVVASAFERLPHNSSLCRLLTQMTAYDWKPKPKRNTQDPYKLPKEFLGDVMTIMARRLPLRFEDEKAPYEEDGCAFHDHKDEAEAIVCRQSRK